MNHTDSQLHWHQDPSKCLAVEVGADGTVADGAKLKLETCQDPCEVKKDPTRQGFCVDVVPTGAFKAIKSSCYGENSGVVGEFDTNHETANTKCIGMGDGQWSVGAPPIVTSCDESQWGQDGGQCWQYIDLYRKCPAVEPFAVPEWTGFSKLPTGGIDCMPTSFPGGCENEFSSAAGKDCCCDGHPWTCETDSFTCGCSSPPLKCPDSGQGQASAPAPGPAPLQVPDASSGVSAGLRTDTAPAPAPAPLQAPGNSAGASAEAS